MLSAAVVDIARIFLSAVLSAEFHSAVMLIVITGAIPALAIATVWAIEGGVKRRSVWPNVAHGGELRNLATRLR